MLRRTRKGRRPDSFHSPHTARAPINQFAHMFAINLQNFAFVPMVWHHRRKLPIEWHIPCTGPQDGPNAPAHLANPGERGGNVPEHDPSCQYHCQGKPFGATFELWVAKFQVFSMSLSIPCVSIRSGCRRLGCPHNDWCRTDLLPASHFAHHAGNDAQIQYEKGNRVQHLSVLSPGNVQWGSLDLGVNHRNVHFLRMKRQLVPA